MLTRVQSNFFIHSRPFFVDRKMIPAIPNTHIPKKIIVVLIFRYCLCSNGWCDNYEKRLAITPISQTSSSIPVLSLLTWISAWQCILCIFQEKSLLFSFLFICYMYYYNTYSHQKDCSRYPYHIHHPSCIRQLLKCRCDDHEIFFTDSSAETI